jgi:NAD(P)-dependent dehydrogenase (short-subunit alcohol dehydrogenase family)
VASTAGLGWGRHDAPEYAAAKAGVIRLSSAVAALAEEANIRVNCLCPGSVDTPAMRRSLERATEKELASVPRVLLRPEDVAEAIIRIIRNEKLVGRALVYREGETPRLVSPSPFKTGNG